MFGVNKDNLVLAALVIALITCFYLFNENKKTKTEIASVKTILNKPQVAAPPPPTVQPKRVRKSEPEPEPESED